MNILIVDDHPIVRLGVRQLLQSRWPDATVREAESLAQAVQAVRQITPTIIILDLKLEDASGLESVQRMRRTCPDVPIMVLSLHEEEAFAFRILQMGAAGYLNKERASEEIVQAVEKVLAGGRYITTSLAQRLAEGMLGDKSEKPLHDTLSTQEYRVLLFLADGKSVGDIAQSMHLSAKTVSTYRTRILDKLGLAGNVDIAKYCISHGLTGADAPHDHPAM